MFPTSTQKQFWTFSDEDTLSKFRRKANLDYIQRFATPGLTDEQTSSYFLTPEEERIIYRAYEFQLRDFCSQFQPPMPNYVIGTAFHYFKRFYLVNSVMDYHPKEILITCTYLACKVEEFNVSIHQFAANLSQGDRARAMETILNSELLLMSALKFQLTIHNPFRPVEGFFIDIKARYNKLDPETIRQPVEDFLKKVYYTDAPLLYAPSQIALAAILQGSSRMKKHSLDTYVTEVLLTQDSPGLPNVIQAIRNVRLMVRALQAPPTPEEVIRLEEKLQNCLNPENNPDSDVYRAKLQDELGEDEMDQSFQSNYNQVGPQ